MELSTAKQFNEIGLEVWQLNDVETWIGFGKESIIKGAVKQTGVPEDELVDKDVLKNEHYTTWDKKYIEDWDAPYQPRYTFTNYINMIINEGVEFPCLLCGTEY
jgi:hypothetical protein